MDKENYGFIGTQLLLSECDLGRQVQMGDKYMTKHVPRCFRGTGTSDHIIVLRRYSPVHATEIRPKDTSRKLMKGQIIVLHRNGPVQDTRTMTKAHTIRP